MSQIAVLDETIFDELNKGNVLVAKQIRRLRDAGAEMWITAQTYQKLTKIPANGQLIMDLMIRTTTQDYYPNQRDPSYIERAISERLSKLPHGTQLTGALALNKGGAILTMNREFERAFNQIGGLVLTYDTGKPVHGPIDYSSARRVLGLPALVISADGKIVSKALPSRSGPTPVVKPSTPATPPPKPSAPPSSGPKGTLGSKIDAPTEHAPNATPKTNALKLGLRGVNWIIQGINDEIQQGRIEQAMARLRPTIEETLERDHSLGVLILIRFRRRKKVGAEHETPLEHTSNFQYIEYEYGRTQDEAQDKFNNQNYIRPVADGELVTQKQWIPPQMAPSFSDLPTPFDKSALATFVDGLEHLVAVKFSIAMGFDDKMKSKIVLSVPRGFMPKFIIMYPPADVRYFSGRWRTKDIEISGVRPRMVVDQDQLAYYVPTINLDSSINPNDARAAMVYPADDATAKLFAPQGRIDDGGVLSSYRLDNVRFVKPEKICILKIL